MQHEFQSDYSRGRGAVLFYMETEKHVQTGLLLLNVKGPRDLLCVESGITLLQLQSFESLFLTTPFYPGSFLGVRAADPGNP